MKKEITIVTAFFDLDREQWKTSPLGREKYAEHFEFWAGLKNKLVVYTDSAMAERVYRIRESYGLKEKTHVIVVDDCTKLDPELYHSIEYAMKQDSARNFHMKPENPESWNAIYNYIMVLKAWCVCDAIDRGLASGIVAWLDFAYNKSGTLYTEKDEFNFLWEGEFDDKVYFYALNNPDDTPVFEIIQRMETYIQGGSFIARDTLWHPLWRLIRDSMFELNDCGLADDDQVVMLMALRKKPEMFEIVKCPWCGVFIGTGVKLTLRKSSKIPGWKKIIKSLQTKMHSNKILNRYIYWQYQNLSHPKNKMN